VTYVNESQLKTKFKEHKNNLRMNQSKHSIISTHVTNNSFDWDNVKIMDRECNFHKRFISEIIHINKEQKKWLKSK